MTLLAIAISSWYFWAWVVCSFAGIVPLAFIDSAWADRKRPKRNRILLVIGIILLLTAGWFLHLTNSAAGTAPNIES